MTKARVWVAACLVGLLVAGFTVFSACSPGGITTETATTTGTTPAESEASNPSLFFVVGGFFLVLVASVLERYCEFGRQARTDVKPSIFKTPIRWVLEALWVIMLLAGGVLLLLPEVVGLLQGTWILALAAVVGFWLILPFLITPFMRNRLLPKWEEVKAELAPKGYTEKNYWRGDWWMKEKKQKGAKGKAPAEPASTSVRRLLSAPQKKDYYATLGLSKGASDEEIRQAYHKLSLEYHPDRNPGRERLAKQKFKEINEAFNVLSNPEKRKKYDAAS